MGEDGEHMVENELVEVATPEDNVSNCFIMKHLKSQAQAKFHVPDQAEIVAAHLVVKMKELIDKDPTAPVGVYKIRVFKLTVVGVSL